MARRSTESPSMTFITRSIGQAPLTCRRISSCSVTCSRENSKFIAKYLCRYSPARQPGAARPLFGRGAVNGAVCHGTFQPDMQRVLPGKTDTPVGLDRCPACANGHFTQVCLAQGGHLAGIIRLDIPAMARVPEQEPGRLQV